MPFSDEFDLDLVTSGNGIPGGNQPQSTSAEVTWAVSSLIIGSVLTGCTGEKRFVKGIFLIRERPAQNHDRALSK